MIGDNFSIIVQREYEKKVLKKQNKDDKEYKIKKLQ